MTGEEQLLKLEVNQLQNQLQIDLKTIEEESKLLQTKEKNSSDLKLFLKSLKTLNDE